MDKYRDSLKTVCPWISFQDIKSSFFSEYMWTDHNQQNRIESIKRFQSMIYYEIQLIPTTNNKWDGLAPKENMM